MTNVPEWDVAAGNNTASSPAGFPELMLPSGVNNSAREVMAAVKRAYNHIKGAFVTAGTAPAYTITTGSSHSQLGYIGAMVVRFHAATSSAATVAVDGLTAKTIVRPSGMDIAAGDVGLLVYVPSDDHFALFPEMDWLDTYLSSALGGLPDGYMSGLAVTLNTSDTEHDLDIAVGEARSADDDTDMVLASALTKQIDASWASGDAAGGLSSSLTLANSTWYYVHAIVVSGAVDVGFDTSATAANLVADHSATDYREIGRFKTDGSANIDIVLDRNQINGVVITTETTPSGGANGDVWYVYT